VLRRVDGVTLHFDPHLRFGLFAQEVGSLRVIKGRKQWLLPGEHSREAWVRWIMAQSHTPLPIDAPEPWHVLWLYDGHVYADSDRMDQAEVKAVLEGREALRRARIDRAKALSVHRQVARSRPRTEIPGEVRLAVWLRDGGRCVRCGVATGLQYDHYLPRSLGGSDEIGNVCVMCGQCNREKSDDVAG
jgi:hypothetical protein